MVNIRKSIVFINIGIILMQICVLFLQINRWNEVFGAIFCIVISIIFLFTSRLADSKERWFQTCCSIILGADIVFQLINVILLICLQWMVVQYCLYSNYTLDIAYYGGIACYDWWQFGYGIINHRDRAMIVTIILAVVIVLRIVHVICLVMAPKYTLSDPVFFSSGPLNYGTPKGNGLTRFEAHPHPAMAHNVNSSEAYRRGETHFQPNPIKASRNIHLG